MCGGEEDGRWGVGKRGGASLFLQGEALPLCLYTILALTSHEWALTDTVQMLTAGL